MVVWGFFCNMNKTVTKDDISSQNKKINSVTQIIRSLVASEFDLLSSIDLYPYATSTGHLFSWSDLGNS